MNDLIGREGITTVFLKNEDGEPLNVTCGLNELSSAEENECEYIVSKGKNGYRQEYKCSVCGDSFYWTPNEMFPNKFNYCRNCGRKIVKFIDESEK